MTPHPNLSDAINLNILQSEQDSGVWAEKIPTRSMLRVQTKNTLYIFHRRDDGSWVVSGHYRYCPTPVVCNIHGSTWGGSMIKTGFIGIRMRMELGIIHNGKPKVITTSPVQSITS